MTRRTVMVIRVIAITTLVVCLALPRGLVAQAQSTVVWGQLRTQRPDGAGGVSGRVVDATAGRPLHGATISLSWRATGTDVPVHFSARTGVDGSFAIEQLPDGAYFVHVRREGFVDPPGMHTARQVEVRGGATIDIGDVRLLRGGVLTGRVLDEHGEPVERARVTPILRPLGHELLTPIGRITTTDDRGVYRAHGLTPGTYTVRAVPIGPSGRGPVRLQGEEPELLPAFAPSAGEPSTADFVEVRAGEEALLDVRLPAGRVATVVGRVAITDDGPVSSGLTVSLRPPAGDMQLHLASGVTRPGGHFEFTDVAPGRYLVVAEEPAVHTRQGPIRRRVGWVEIAVTGEPVTGVVVPMGYGSTVRGRIEVDGGEFATLVGRPPHVVASASAERRPLPGPSIHAQVTRDLTFELTDVWGHRQVQVMGLPSGWWLKSVLIEGEDAVDGHAFPVSGTVDGVVLLVSARPSGITGRVQGTGGQLQGASVVVLPGDGSGPRPGPAARRDVASVAADGAFTATGVRPGRYTLVALSPRARSAYDRLGREARQALIAAHGRPVDVVEGRLETVTLRLVEH